MITEQICKSIIIVICNAIALINIEMGALENFQNLRIWMSTNGADLQLRSGDQSCKSHRDYISITSHIGSSNHISHRSIGSLRAEYSDVLLLPKKHVLTTSNILFKFHLYSTGRYYCLSVFFKIFNFLKTDFLGFSGSLITKMTSVFGSEAYLQWNTKKMSTF